MSLPDIHPALWLLLCKRWDSALQRCIDMTEDAGAGGAIGKMMPLPKDHDEVHRRIAAIADSLYVRRQPSTGRLALAWQMLLADPRKPHSFWPVITQLPWIAADAKVQAELMIDERIQVWWAGAAGVLAEEKLSMFALTAAAIDKKRSPDSDEEAAVEEFDGPGIVILPKKTASKVKSDHAQWKDLIDARLPLVVARDVAKVHGTLLAEHPHAATAVDLLLRDLRDGEPVRMKPVILLGPPGNSKSRLIRRLGELLGIGVYRFDGGSSTDGVGYGGTPRGWSESTPCVPARAIMAYKIANPIAMVDEIEKASPNPRNGALWSVMLAHLDKETASRFRDAALDSEMDLSWVLHLATANSIDQLPDPLKDRYRIIKVPAPRLADLPALAANVVREIAAENGEQGFEIALAGDELDVIAKAWQRAGFSIRKLQKIVSATIDARDQHAMRH